MKNKKVLHLLYVYARLALASLCIAIGISIFLLPNNFSVGGVMGISSIIYLLSNKAVSYGLLFILLNLPFLVVGFRYLGKKFALRTGFCVVLAAAFVDLFNFLDITGRFEVLFDMQNAVLFSIAGGVLVSVGLMLTFAVSASSGGADIVGAILQRKYAIANVSRFLIAAEIIVVAVLAIFLKSFSNFMYSCTAVFSSEIVFQLLQDGMSSAVAFEIVTDKPNEIVKAISEKLNRGTTAINAIGMYNNTPKHIVVCVVNKRQEIIAKQLIKQVDSQSFAYSLPVKEVLGKGFRNIDGLK